ATVAAAVDALAPASGQVVADVGFGGGLGLALLLDRVGPAGRVHGVDLSRVMIGRARRRHRHAGADRRPVPHEAAMTNLPLAAASVDAAMTVNTIYFVPDSVFAELTEDAVDGSGDAEGLGGHPRTPTSGTSVSRAWAWAPQYPHIGSSGLGVRNCHHAAR